jgi:uncharacterized membrane protein YedE/YeeE
MFLFGSGTGPSQGQSSRKAERGVWSIVSWDIWFIWYNLSIYVFSLFFFSSPCSSLGREQGYRNDR